MGRVEIDISNLRKFQDVALLVDREDVLKAIISLRRKVKRLEKRIPKPLSLANYLRYAPDISLKAQSILRKYKYPPGFASAIEAAIRNNKIADKDVEHCYFRIHLERVFDKELPRLDSPKEAVMVTIYPYLLKGRGKKIMNELKELVLLLNQDIIKLPKKHPLNLDIRPLIRQEREWYWKNKEKVPTKRLVDEYNKTKPNDEDWIDDENQIDQVISDYRKLLKAVF